jgi:phosphatidylethanolamine-binding protein (PEBP) family uncharacterized protein
MKAWIGIAGALASASALAGGPVAMQHPGMQAVGPLQVTSSSFRANAAIPARYSAYHDGISPALAWSRVDKAKSYALLVEDPDAPMATPFVHWVAWNIPANATSLPEGLQGKAHADGMVQGASGIGKPVISARARLSRIRRTTITSKCSRSTRRSRCRPARIAMRW